MKTIVAAAARHCVNSAHEGLREFSSFQHEGLQTAKGEQQRQAHSAKTFAGRAVTLITCRPRLGKRAVRAPDAPYRQKAQGRETESPGHSGGKGGARRP